MLQNRVHGSGGTLSLVAFASQGLFQLRRAISYAKKKYHCLLRSCEKPPSVKLLKNYEKP
jgi:hypothetical protein